MTVKTDFLKKTKYIKELLKGNDELPKFSNIDYKDDIMVRGYVEHCVFLIGQYCFELVDYICGHVKSKFLNDRLLMLEKEKIFNKKDTRILTELISLKEILSYESDLPNCKKLLDVLYDKKYNINKFIQIADKY